MIRQTDKKVGGSREPRRRPVSSGWMRRGGAMAAGGTRREPARKPGPSAKEEVGPLHLSERRRGHEARPPYVVDTTQNAVNDLLQFLFRRGIKCHCSSHHEFSRHSIPLI